MTFSAHSLRDCLKTNDILSADYKMPSLSRLEPFADLLTTFSHRYMLSEAMLTDEALREQARGAVVTLKKVLPPLLEKAEKNMEQIARLQLREMPVSRQLKARRDALRNFLTGISSIEVTGALAKELPEKTKIQTWHEYAAQTADEFRAIVHQTNPTKPRLENSYNGPVARFLATVIPMISLERPKLGTIAKFLQRKRGHN